MSRLPARCWNFRHLFTCERPGSYFPSTVNSELSRHWQMAATRWFVYLCKCEYLRLYCITSISRPLFEAVLDQPQQNFAHVTTVKCAKFRWNRPNTFTTKATQNVIVEIYLNSIIGAGPGNQFDLSVAGCQLRTVTPLANSSDPLVCLLVQSCEYLRLYCITSRRPTENLFNC